jgi:hypothetical protein
MFGPGQPNGVYGYQPYSLNPLNSLNGNSPFLNSDQGPVLSSTQPLPFAVTQQESSAGEAILDKARQVSGIDSRVFDAQSQDRLILRDQREVTGMGDPNGLVQQPPQVPVPVPPPTTPSAAPSSANPIN